MILRLLVDAILWWWTFKRGGGAGPAGCPVGK
jgi:hypothetical protein